MVSQIEDVIDSAGDARALPRLLLKTESSTVTFVLWATYSPSPPESLQEIPLTVTLVGVLDVQAVPPLPARVLRLPHMEHRRSSSGADNRDILRVHIQQMVICAVT